MSNTWYLNKADHCERLAQDATDPDRRLGFENDAKAWRRMAERMEELYSAELKWFVFE